MVDDAVRRSGFATDLDISLIDAKKHSLEKEIMKDLYYARDIYDTVQLSDGKKYFKVEGKFQYKYHRTSIDKAFECYILASKFKTKDSFTPVDVAGNPSAKIKCQFDGQGACKVIYSDYDYHSFEFIPKVLFNKGDKKQDVNDRLVKSLRGSVKAILNELGLTLNQVHRKYKKLKVELSSPFVTDVETEVAVTGISEQIDQIKLRIVDCERLESLCQQS